MGEMKARLKSRGTCRKETGRCLANRNSCGVVVGVGVGDRVGDLLLLLGKR